MEVTKRLTPKKDRLWHGTCRSCGSEATAKAEELTITTGTPREPNSFAWHVCPVCGVGPYGGMLFYESTEQSIIK